MPKKSSGSADNSDTRARILDATEQIMLEEGYAGVSYRKITSKAGLKSNLIHHYFKTMDDLFIAAFQRREGDHVGRLASATSSANPLQDIWAMTIDGASSKLVLEYNALACHRPALREYIAMSAARDRKTVTGALETIFGRYNIDQEIYPPKVVAMAMAGLARAFALERALGTYDGHAESLAVVDRLLASFESAPTPSPRRKRSANEDLPTDPA